MFCAQAGVQVNMARNAQPITLRILIISSLSLRNVLYFMCYSSVTATLQIVEFGNVHRRVQPGSFTAERVVKARQSEVNRMLIVRYSHRSLWTTRKGPTPG